jgi:hypothetical protein
VPDAQSRIGAGVHHQPHVDEPFVDEPSMGGPHESESLMGAQDGATREALRKLVGAVGGFHAQHSRLASARGCHSEWRGMELLHSVSHAEYSACVEGSQLVPCAPMAGGSRLPRGSPREDGSHGDVMGEA